MLKIVDRYIFLEIVEPFFSSVLTFTCILTGGGILFTLVGEIVRYHLSLWTAGELFLMRLPQVITYTFPMAMLLGTLLGLSRLSGAGEITAFRAGGVPLLRLALPVLFLGLLVTGAAYFFNEYITPRATHRAEEIYFDVSTKGQPKIAQNINIPQYENGSLRRTVSARSLDKGVLQGVIVQEFENNQPVRVITAEEAGWQEDRGWLLSRGKIYQISAGGESLYLLKFDQQVINIGVSLNDLNQRQLNPQEMNSHELKDYIQKMRRQGEDVKQLEVQLNLKTAIPFASFIFALIGLSLGPRPGRTSGALSFGLSVLIIFFYYVILALSMGLGLMGLMPPFWAAWLPNLAGVVFGVFMLTRYA